MHSSLVERLADEVRRIAFQRSTARGACAHIAEIGPADVAPERLACPSCEAQGTVSVKLRMCRTCGAVGCCDSSRGQHARAHFDATGHPVIRSIEPGEAWSWCYPDRTYVASSEPT